MIKWVAIALKSYGNDIHSNYKEKSIIYIINVHLKQGNM